MASNNSGNSRAVVFLLIGLLASVAATVVLWQLIEGYNQKIATAQKPEDTVTILVASRELFPGVQITEEDIWEVKVPRTYLPGAEEGTVYTSAAQIVGSIPRDRILPNEFIRQERLADGTTGAGLNAIIPQGMRAISIGIKDGAGLSGMIRPADRVDVVVTIVPDDGKAPETRTLLQAVYVLAVNDKMEAAEEVEDPNDKKRKKKAAKGQKRIKPTVTLAVYPDQAEQVAHSEKKGEITLTLRNAQDSEYEERDGTTGLNELLGRVPVVPDPVAVAVVPKVVKPPPVVEVAEPEQTFQIIRGDKTETKVLDSSGEIKGGKK